MCERLLMLENSPWHYAWEALDLANKLPTVRAWVHRMRAYPAFKDFVPKSEHWAAHLEIQGASLGVKQQLTIDYLKK